MSYGSWGRTVWAELVPADARCYVTIDIDSLDHSLVPGCVSAEPGGLTYDELRGALVALAERVEIVRLDLVEVNPMVDTERHRLPRGPSAGRDARRDLPPAALECRQSKGDKWKISRASGLRADIFPR